MIGEDSSLDRLSRISTRWSLLVEAHAADGAERVLAQTTLLARYSSAVFRYLLGAVRDADVAEDLSQEFALRLLRGDFRRANPAHGRFRHYVKSVLSNLANDHFRSKARRPQPLGDTSLEIADVQPETPDFDGYLREELLAQTWELLKQSQPRYHAVLLLRVKQPELSSDDLAAQLTAQTQLQTQWTAATARKTLERARTRFAELLLDEVESSLACDTLDDLHANLVDLDLLRYCKSALRRRSEASPSDQTSCRKS
ncbi:MAG TPA: sigma factor [Pirellulales bacterium]|nr:sigma factor [Pirellulales bacterium]